MERVERFAIEEATIGSSGFYKIFRVETGNRIGIYYMFHVQKFQTSTEF